MHYSSAPSWVLSDSGQGSSDRHTDFRLQRLGGETVWWKKRGIRSAERGIRVLPGVR